MIDSRIIERITERRMGSGFAEPSRWAAAGSGGFPERNPLYWPDHYKSQTVNTCKTATPR